MCRLLRYTPAVDHRGNPYRRRSSVVRKNETAAAAAAEMNCIRLYLQQGSYSRSDYTVDGRREPADDLTEFGVWSRHCVAGGTSAAITKTLSAPLDRVRTHMQVKQYKYNTMVCVCVWECARLLRAVVYVITGSNGISLRRRRRSVIIVHLGGVAFMTLSKLKLKKKKNIKDNEKKKNSSH